jgi:protein-histidine pros-kinase
MTNENIAKLRELSGHLIDPDIAIAMFEELPDAIILVDDQARIQLVNKQTELLFGYARRELFDHPVEMLLPEAVRERHVAHRDAYFQDPRVRPMGVGMVLSGRHKNGREFEVEINLSPIVPGRHGSLYLAVVRRTRRQA